MSSFLPIKYVSYFIEIPPTQLAKINSNHVKRTVWLRKYTRGITLDFPLLLSWLDLLSLPCLIPLSMAHIELMAARLKFVFDVWGETVVKTRHCTKVHPRTRECQLLQKEENVSLGDTTPVRISLCNLWSQLQAFLVNLFSVRLYFVMTFNSPTSFVESF